MCWILPYYAILLVHVGSVLFFVSKSRNCSSYMLVDQDRSSLSTRHLWTVDASELLVLTSCQSVSCQVDAPKYLMYSMQTMNWCAASMLICQNSSWMLWTSWFGLLCPCSSTQPVLFHCFHKCRWKLDGCSQTIPTVYGHIPPHPMEIAPWFNVDRYVRGCLSSCWRNNERIALCQAMYQSIHSCHLLSSESFIKSWNRFEQSLGVGNDRWWWTPVKSLTVYNTNICLTSKVRNHLLRTAAWIKPYWLHNTKFSWITMRSGPNLPASRLVGCLA